MSVMDLLTPLAAEAINDVIKAVAEGDKQRAEQALELAIARQTNKIMADNRRKQLKS